MRNNYTNIHLYNLNILIFDSWWRIKQLNQTWSYKKI